MLFQVKIGQEFKNHPLEENNFKTGMLFLILICFGLYVPGILDLVLVFFQTIICLFSHLHVHLDQDLCKKSYIFWSSFLMP